MAESRDISAPSDCTSFLEFADRLNIPINQGYLNHLDDQIKSMSFGLNAIDVGVKDSKSHKKFNERRIQNALWRAWWRQRSTRFNSEQKRLQREDEQQIEPVIEEMNFLWGSNIGDIPTEYTIPADLEDHELPVIGTYVDSYVIPGFSYRVRVCGSKQKEYLFDGKALRLDRVGAGYGKRLTFEDEDILDCDNFFWSDSNPDGGFAFSVSVVNDGQKFKVFGPTDEEVGEVNVTDVDPQQQILSSRMDDLTTILEVRVEFKIDFTATDIVPESFRGNKECISGIAKMIRNPQTKSAVLDEIIGVDIPDLGICRLSKV